MHRRPATWLLVAWHPLAPQSDATPFSSLLNILKVKGQRSQKARERKREREREREREGGRGLGVKGGFDGGYISINKKVVYIFLSKLLLVSV